MTQRGTPKPDCDIAIIGAGPAGLNACLHALAGGAQNVVLLDRRKPGDHAIACAEGAGLAGLERAIACAPRWIRTTISSATLHSPNNSTLSYTNPGKGVILDRRTMQRDLANDCLERGARGLFDRNVTTVTQCDTDVMEVGFKEGSPLTARIVVDASGPLSRLGHGLGVSVRARDLEPSLCVIADNVPMEPNTVHVYVGALAAPGGYAWVFPSEGTTVSIGIVTGRSSRQGATLPGILACFIKRHFPHARIIRQFAGAIPCAGTQAIRATSGFVKAGDAAETVNPITRAGIVEALVSGGLAGDCAVEQLGSQTQKQVKVALKKFHRSWAEQAGKKHAKLARVKKALSSVPDNDYNNAVPVLAQMPRSKLTAARLFSFSFYKYPRLAAALRLLI